MAKYETTSSRDLPQAVRSGAGVGQCAPEDYAARQAMVLRLRDLHKNLQAEHGGLFPDSTDLIRRMRDSAEY